MSLPARPIRRTWVRLFAVLTVVLLLNACAGFFSGHPSRDIHTVKAGETLYSIAWSVGKDHRDLAAWNGIPPPYLIKPGQKLRLTPASGARVVSQPQSARHHRVKRGETIYSIARRYGLSPHQLAKANNIRSPYLIKPGQRLRIEKLSSSPRASRKSSRGTTRPGQKGARVRSSGITWAWPVTGSVLRKFGQVNSKGIDIAGRKDKKIRAAAKGRVVYKGSGLRGYGNLVIIKHNNDYLSAYAHCRKIYVKEGDVIQKGSRIASMGKSGTDTVKLHFEIRYKGTPVDPLKYLPNR